MMLAYDIENKDVYFRITGEFRKSGADKMSVSRDKGRVYHIYLAFNAEDRSRQSDSIYLGIVTI